MTLREKITTYATIDEAFKKGRGDCFYTLNERFVCVSRKESHDFLINAGFTFLTYNEVVKLAALQKKSCTEPKKETQVTQKNKYYKIHYLSNHTMESFRDEYPDAIFGL